MSVAQLYAARSEEQLVFGIKKELDTVGYRWGGDRKGDLC